MSHNNRHLNHSLWCPHACIFNFIVTLTITPPTLGRSGSQGIYHWLQVWASPQILGLLADPCVGSNCAGVVRDAQGIKVWKSVLPEAFTPNIWIRDFAFFPQNEHLHSHAQSKSSKMLICVWSFYFLKLCMHVRCFLAFLPEQMAFSELSPRAWPSLPI